jgi:hypothetical protein
MEGGKDRVGQVMKRMKRLDGRRGWNWEFGKGLLGVDMTRVKDVSLY